ncbi:cell wall protein IFF6-like isoform X2 [Spodoptera litura]|uniref:Cell wall protein IFF6-like isoform X2 n=1 Tax=Spodoptera litura TaxID=69820 RepID=A0A9J7E649_SPOLT|nr:cell wall protein IFF6-like isoform X2 [Spodoptera litura]
MSCGVVCVFIIFICQNGLLQLSNAEENATTTAEQPTTKSSTQESLAQDPPAEDPTTQKPTAINATALNATTQDSPESDSSTKGPKQDLLTVDPPSPKSPTKDGNTTDNLKQNDEVVSSNEPPKLVSLVEDELPTQTKNDSKVTPTATSPQTAEDETKIEETSSTKANSTDALSTDKESKKTDEDEPGTKDAEKVKTEIKSGNKENNDVELSTIAPPKDNETPYRRAPMSYVEVRDDIERVVSKGVDSAKDIAGGAYNVMRSAFSNVINK